MHRGYDAIVREDGTIVATGLPRFGGTRRAILIVLEDDTVPPTVTTPTAPATGRYRVVRALGEGGMGATLLALDSSTSAQVCIKQLRPGINPSSLVQEWHALSRLRSPYVVSYLDRYVEADSLHLVMEYDPGPTLGEFAGTRTLTTAEIRECTLNLFRALVALHSYSVIHRDIKPANVLVSTNAALLTPGQVWIPRLIDLGLAVLDSHDADGVQTGAGQIAGTPAYMAPEQARGWMVTPACDVYAVGLIAWELAARRRAFHGSLHELLVAKTAQTEPVDASPLAAHFPPPAAKLVQRCTHPNPDERPAALDMVRALEPLV